MIAVLLAFTLAQDPAPEVRPVMVNNSYVDPFTGKERGIVEAASRFSAALPVAGKPGLFDLWPREDNTGPRLRADASTRTFAECDDPSTAFVGKTLFMFGKGRKKAWQVELPADGGGVRPPDALISERAVVVAHGAGLSAFEPATGKLLWTAKGINDRLCFYRDLVLATDCSSKGATAKRFLLARRISDGSEAWSVEIMTDDEPTDISLVGGHALIRTEAFHEKKASSLLVDERGAVALRLDEYVFRAQVNNGGWLLLTGRRFARIMPGGRVAWEQPLPAGRSAFDDVEILLDDDRAYIWSWGPISDSGVQVTRINPATGEVAWKVDCAPLGVEHSKYWHVPYVELRGDKLVVVSQGAGGWFVETLATKDGKAFSRFMRK